MKILYLDSIAGIAGDMFTASFIDAGLVTLDELNHLGQQLNIANIQVSLSETLRAHMRGTHIDVSYDQAAWDHYFSHETEQHDHEHVPYYKLDELISESDLSNEVKVLAKKILGNLAEAEAHCHAVTKDDVVFHEIGMADSLMDIVMAAYCICKCKPDQIIASPIKLGRGVIHIAHGTQPVPPPVSAALAVDMSICSIPAVIQKPDVELSTPTGLAILKTLNPQFSSDWPEGKILHQGYGAGSMDLGNYPNLFRVVLIETTMQALPYDHDKIVEMNVNYDDTTPEHLAWASKKLFDYGALDVWQTTGVGKKGRVMIVLSAIIPETGWEQCADFILKNTPTFGLRYRRLDRLKLRRHIEQRETPQGTVRVKMGYDVNEVKIKEKMEFSDIEQHWDAMLIDKEP